ncbi:hypothetical protein Nepgr_010627 [Nepenthes gracilis]|uniref:Reverse transcriptase domain-containing protein n=1 Tax=Nepenthes gracilis TaxID=150966 RepID=A0AAD3XL89_NEPGR|nr:hypothetical protein Nepgr_010627 [Nepenthes gracilis]
MCVQIGGSLTGILRNELITFLQRNADIFAWTPADMPEILAEVMVHKLGLYPSQKPVRQKQRNHSVEKSIAIREEVKKLLDAGFIREVNFTDVNKACQKYNFPFPGSTCQLTQQSNMSC